MTPAQLSTLKTFILADPTLGPLASQGAYGPIRAALNTEASPAFVVWKSTCQTNDIGGVINYVAVAAMTTANLDRLRTMYQCNPTTFDPSRSDIRTFLADTFSGALGGQGQATRDALEALYRRNATVAEKALATGTGSFASPATAGFEGQVSDGDVETALRA